MPEFEKPRRSRNLTDEDLDAIAERFRCTGGCSFTSEEIQFVKDWLDTAKTAKSEVIKWAVRGVLWFIGIVAGIQVAIKFGYFKLGVKGP